MRILLATRNPGKFSEMKEVLTAFVSADFVGPDDVDGAYAVDEDGRTFAENAIKKAKEWAKKSGFVTVADDGGLEIDVLGGEPGVKSRRWPGHEATDEELVRMALEKLKGIPWEKRAACLRTVVALAFPDGRTKTAAEEICGIIAQKATEKRDAGYPFRSLFWLPDLKKFYIDLTQEEHAQCNHRRKALRKIAELL